MGQVTALLNSIGWTLPVLPELDDLTVGECSVFMVDGLGGLSVTVEEHTPPPPYSRATRRQLSHTPFLSSSGNLMPSASS